MFRLGRPPSPFPPHVMECNKASCNPLQPICARVLGFMGSLCVLLWKSLLGLLTRLHTTFVRGGERWLLPRISRKLGAPLLHAYGLGLLEKELEPCVMGDGNVGGREGGSGFQAFAKYRLQASHPAPSRLPGFCLAYLACFFCSLLFLSLSPLMWLRFSRSR